MVRIAISGASGKMGQTLIEAVNQSNMCRLTVTLDLGEDLKKHLNDFDTLIDFTRPEATLAYLPICAEAGKKMVIGTTGFSPSEQNKIKDYSQKTALVLAPNMSVGVNLSLDLLAKAAKVIGRDADIEIIEKHHRFKVDAPSGTALKMGEVIAETLGRNLADCSVYGREGIGEVRDKNTIGFATVRGGDVVGEHTVSFMLDGECLEISHKASSRMTFALGGLRAALWLSDKKAGFYTMQNVLNL